MTKSAVATDNPRHLRAGYATLNLSDLDLSTSDGTIVKKLALRGVSRALMFEPALTLRMSRVPRAHLPQASALTNSLRQLSPAFATAAFATILISRQAVHFSGLAQLVKPDSLAVVQVPSGLEQAAGSYGVPDGLAEQTAVQLPDEFVQRQAAVRAFDDVLLIAAILAFVALVPAVFLRKPKPEEMEPSTGTVDAPEPAN